MLEWEDIRETLDIGSIDKKGIVEMVKASQKDKSSNSLTYEEFKTFVDSLNDYIVQYGPEENEDGFETIDKDQREEKPIVNSSIQKTLDANEVFEDEYKSTYDRLCGDVSSF